MKPAPFTYHRPRTADEAAAILAACAGDEARILAGGQTLVPAMALRLARPAHIVDINRVAEFTRLAAEGGWLRIGACVRHAELGPAKVPGVLGALLGAVRQHIAHYPIRVRGTFCGSLANADPAAEWCLVAVTLGAELTLLSARGSRVIGIEDFLLGYMATALEPDEILAEARLPLLPPDTRFGFHEYSRRAGDFAQVMALATYRLREGVMADVRIAVGALDSRPRLATEAARALSGRPAETSAFAAAARAGAAELLAGEAGSYRAHLAETAILRALEQSRGDG
jgi:carbon-monoxide dehydrogenase medium subunit